MRQLLKPHKYNLQYVYGSKIAMYVLLVVSICLTATLLLLGALGLLEIIPTASIGLNAIDFMVYGILSAIGPIGFYSHIKMKRKKDIENSLPDFLREISSATASGMTVFDAIHTASLEDRGFLTNEIRRMSAQLSWGIPVQDALNNFAKRVGTNPVKRMVITINKALEIGGNTAAVFEAAAKEIDQSKRVEMQRRTEMSMYSIVIFISFFVFLAVILIIDKTIFAAIFDLQDQMAGQAIGNMRIADIDHDLLGYTFFSFLLVQSIGGGLLGGFMMDGRLSSGVRFGFILVIVTFFVFKFMF